MTIHVAIPLFDRLTALDAIGPYEVLQRIPTIDVTFVGRDRGEVRCDTGFLGLVADATYDDVPRPDVVVVPGGPGTRALATGDPILEWLRQAHPSTLMTTSVCTGSVVLGAAGLLAGLTATTHWSTYDELARTGAHPTGQRVVEHLERRIITAAGVSSGIDMALRLVEILVDRTGAESAQLMIEYDPDPPVHMGSLDAATPAVMRRVRQYAALRS